MSDQIDNPGVTAIDESTLDAAVVEHFTKKFAPVVAKKDELLSSVAELKAFKKAVEDIGGMEALKGLQTQAEEARNKAEQDRLAKLSADERLAEIEANYRREIQSRDEKLTSWQKRAIDREVDAALASAIRSEDGVPELLSHALRSRVEAAMGDDGEVKIVVKGANGQNLDDKGNPFTLKGLVAEFKSNDVYGAAFKANPSSGAGAGKGSRQHGGDNPFAKNTWSVTKQMEMIKNAPDVARALATAAGEPADW